MKISNLVLFPALFGALCAITTAQNPPGPAPRKLPAGQAKAATLQKGLRQHERIARPTYGNSVARGPVGPLAVVETERNDSLGFADALSTPPDYDGDINPASDADCVAIPVSSAGLVTFDVSQVGSSPIADATLLITDVHGAFVAFNDDRGGGSLMPLITVSLPAGTYIATIRSFAAVGTGTYRLTTTVTPTTFAPANMNGTTSGTVPPNGEVTFRLPFTTDTQLSMNITANGGQDLYCVLLRPTGAVQRFVDDGISGSSNPSLDTHLPGLSSGEYLLAFGDFNGTGGAFSFNITSSAGPVPAIACGGSSNGSVAGSEGEVMRRITLTTADTIGLTVTGGTMTDSWINLYDRNLTRFLYNDDSNNTPFSNIGVALPAGTYYVGVQSFGNFSAGSFTLNLACSGSFAPTAGRFGDNAMSIAAIGGTAVHRVATGTPCQIETVVTNPGQLLPMAAILNGSGVCGAFSDSADFEMVGMAANGSDHFVLVRDYFAAPGTCTTLVGGALYFQATTKGTLTMQDKAGDVQFLFAAVSPLPGGFPVPLPFTGNLLMLPPLISLPPQPIGASGVATYPASFPAGPYLVQSLSLFTVPALGGAMTNVAD